MDFIAKRGTKYSDYNIVVLVTRHSCFENFTKLIFTISLFFHITTVAIVLLCTKAQQRYEFPNYWLTILVTAPCEPRYAQMLEGKSSSSRKKKGLSEFLKRCFILFNQNHGKYRYRLILNPCMLPNVLKTGRVELIMHKCLYWCCIHFRVFNKRKNAKTEKMKIIALSISSMFISYSTLGFVLCPSTEFQ